MPELNYKTIGGLLVAIVLSSIGTIYIKEATGYKSCSTGWVSHDNGQFICESRDIAPQWCYKLSKPNSEGISTRCYLGVLVEDKPKQKITVDEIVSKGDYTISTDGETCYIKGNLRRGVPCET